MTLPTNNLKANKHQAIAFTSDFPRQWDKNARKKYVVEFYASCSCKMFTGASKRTALCTKQWKVIENSQTHIRSSFSSKFSNLLEVILRVVTLLRKPRRACPSGDSGSRDLALIFRGMQKQPKTTHKVKLNRKVNEQYCSKLLQLSAGYVLIQNMCCFFIRKL